MHRDFKPYITAPQLLEVAVRNSNFRGRKFRSRENEIKMQKCLVYRDFKPYMTAPQLLEVGQQFLLKKYVQAYFIEQSIVQVLTK